MKSLLDECLQLNDRLKDIKGKICEIETTLYCPRNQIISDMPKGKGTAENNKVEKLLQKLEKLRKKRESIEKKLLYVWSIIAKRLDEINVSEDEKRLFKLRFYHGYLWKDCVGDMNEKSNVMWNENKIFRTYSAVCDRLHKKVK